jgi:hypothetical protein
MQTERLFSLFLHQKLSVCNRPKADYSEAATIRSGNFSKDTFACTV